MMNLMVTPQDKHFLSTLAKREGISMAELARRFLAEYRFKYIAAGLYEPEKTG